MLNWECVWVLFFSLSHLFSSVVPFVVWEIPFRILFISIWFLFTGWCSFSSSYSQLISLMLRMLLLLLMVIFFSLSIFITLLCWLSIKRSFLFRLRYRLHLVDTSTHLHTDTDNLIHSLSLANVHIAIAVAQFATEYRLQFDRTSNRNF